MEAGASRLGRARSLAVSPETFRLLAYLALGSLFLIILTGAAVRLTGSGLGCANWPRCSDTSLLPERDFHALVEFGNRLVSMPVGFLTLATAVSAWFVRGLPRWVGWSAVAVVVVVVVEAWLGGMTVKSELDPVVVMVHFLLALVAVALAVAIVVGAHAHAAGAPARTLPRELGWLALALVPVAAVLVVTGAFVTAAGPHSGGADVIRLGNLVETMEVHVRAAAVFGVGFLVLVAVLWRRRDEARAELVLAGATLAVLLTQTAVGELQWRNRLPWWLVLVHVALATAIWAGVVALAARLLSHSSSASSRSAHHARAPSR